MVNGPFDGPKLAVVSQTRPSGATRGSEPLSPTLAAYCKTNLGLDQLPCVPFRRACVYEA